MKLNMEEFEKIWVSSDEETKRRFAYIGFVHCAALLGRLVDSGVLNLRSDKKEEP